MKAKSWLLCGVLVASMAGAVGSASAQTYVYSVAPVPPPTGASVAVVLEARDGEEVTATVQAYTPAGVLGDDARNVTVPGNGFVRLNNADLGLGHDTGSRRIVVLADREINVSAMRRIWGDHAVALAVRSWVTTAVPPAMSGCADEAEFTRLAVGNEFFGYFGDPLRIHFRFLEGNRFEDSEETYDPAGGPRAIGNYVYRKVGPSTATIRVLFDDSDGARCFLILSCTSPTTGTVREFCTGPGSEDGEIVDGQNLVDWEILPPVGGTVSGSR